MLIHPSLIEKAVLDTREYNDEVAADVKRSFAYVGPVTVTARAPQTPDAPVCNELKLICRMSKPYWTDEGQGAEMWDAMRTWLEAKALKVAATVENFNKSRGEAGRQTVDYDRVELDMKPYALGIACTQADTLPDLVGCAQRLRELLAAGVVPADAARVDIPAAASLAEQVARAEQARQAAEQAQAQGEEGAAEGENPQVGETGEAAAAAQAEDAEAQDGEGAGDAEQVAEQPAEQAAAQPEGAQGQADETAGEDGGEGAAETAQPAAQPERLAHASDGLEQLDCTLWDVTLADGSVRTLDSAAGAWV